MIPIIMLLVVVAIFGVVIAMLSLGQRKAGYISQQQICHKEDIRTSPPADHVYQEHPQHHQHSERSDDHRHSSSSDLYQEHHPRKHRKTHSRHRSSSDHHRPNFYTDRHNSDTEFSLGIPVPAGTLRATDGYGYLVRDGRDFPYIHRPLASGDFFRGFVGSVHAGAPFSSVNTPWEKAGILTSTDDEILNFFRRPIAPMQELWEYEVQDKDGFVIRLDITKLLEDGDIIEDIIGKQGQGPWHVHMFVKNRYVWV